MPEGDTIARSATRLRAAIAGAELHRVEAPRWTGRLPTVGETVLDVRVQFFGTRSGDDVSSNTFRYPVTVCHDCLTNVLGPCAALPTDVEIRDGGACGPDQDGVIDCCLAADLTTRVCPAVPPVPTT